MTTIAINSDQAKEIWCSNLKDGQLDPVQDPKSPWTKYLVQEHIDEYFAEQIRIYDLRYETEDRISHEEYMDLLELNNQKYGYDTAIAFPHAAPEVRKRVGTKLLNS